MNRAKKKPPRSLPPYAVRKSPVHGNGVFVTRKIPADTRIIEYRGERIAWKEAAKRETGEEDYHTFYFSLEDGRVIDAAVRGSDARWINHACEPNCEAREENGRVFIYALRDIRRGEELSYNYSLIVDERHTPALKRAYACRCGAATCRGTMLEQKRRSRPAKLADK